VSRSPTPRRHLGSWFRPSPYDGRPLQTPNGSGHKSLTEANHNGSTKLALLTFVRRRRIQNVSGLAAVAR
jgi:hypothetical protein